MEEYLPERTRPTQMTLDTMRHYILIFAKKKKTLICFLFSFFLVSRTHTNACTHRHTHIHRNTDIQFKRDTDIYRHTAACANTFLSFWLS